MAIGAAESLLKALKLSSSVDERRQLKVQCGEIMSVADRIKNDSNWTPMTQQPRPKTKEKHTDLWATNVALSGGPDTVHDQNFSQASSSSQGLSSVPVPIVDVQRVLGKSSNFSSSRGVCDPNLVLPHRPTDSIRVLGRLLHIAFPTTLAFPQLQGWTLSLIPFTKIVEMQA